VYIGGGSSVRAGWARPHAIAWPALTESHTGITRGPPGYRGLVWMLYLLVFVALLAAASLFAFPAAIPVVAIVVVVVALLMAPVALTAAKNKAKKANAGTRNWRGEITDLGYVDKEQKIPRTQRAVFFGTPQWEQYKREKGLVPAASRPTGTGRVGRSPLGP
jgi:hypothetical protein